MAIGVVVLALIILFIYYHAVHKRRHYPPGPTPWPLLGNAMALLALGGNIDLKLIEWRKKYGDIYTFWIGGTPLVTVNGYDQIEKIFGRDDSDGSLSDRFNYSEENSLTRGERVYFRRFCHPSCLQAAKLQGDLWRSQRRFSLTILRDLGVSRPIMTGKILEQVDHMFDTIDTALAAGEPELNIADHIEIRVGSIMNALLFNYGFSGNRSKEFYELKRLLSEYVHRAGEIKNRIAQSNSRLYYLVPSLNRHVKATRACADQLLAFFRRQIDEHRARPIDDTAAPNDIVEAYLREQRKGQDPSFTDRQLEHLVLDLYLAGQETTATVLTWLVIYLLEHPDVQRKLHEELDRVIGSARPITPDDKPKLHYSQAVIAESLRLSNIIVMGGHHRTTRDVQVDKFMIPKVPQISTVLYDEEIYAKPRDFNPERFLDANGKISRAPELVAFGLGKRVCLGESLARAELFLLAANLFNRYKVSSRLSDNKISRCLQLSTGKASPSHRRNLGGTVYPSPFTCRVVPRYN